ncbi:MAG TPA: hypothetical protein PLM22_01910 [Candidatus Sabulitectum sp.]|nr:hypothetical protein [Candidatus Sabulitectum sp.]HPR21364.1 hypothetical protein [Candidatus Sabulitectum sp.]
MSSPKGKGTARALGAFSGGLDGMLAARLLMEQGIEVHAVTFTSPFFSGESGMKAAEELGIPWRAVDFTEEIFALIKAPPSGFGKNMNPCIDCHAAMFAILSGMAREEGFDFIFSGEVLGQRPMSQNKGSLNRVRNLSETAGILLRPLSALLMPPTPMEENGLVDRERLLDLNGRGRTRQLELAEKYGFSFVPSPAGGCLLTDPGYSRRLAVLRDLNLLTPDNALMVRFGRMFVLKGSIGLVGRTKDENRRIREAGKGCLVDIKGVPSPLGVLLGKADAITMKTLAAIVASFTKGSEPFTAVTSTGEFETRRMPIEEREALRVIL